MQRKEGAFLQAPTLPFRFWLTIFPSHFYPSILNVYSWHLLLLKQEKRKKTLRKKNHKEEEKCREGKELSFKLLLYPLTFGSHFWLPIFALLFQMLSFGNFLFSSKKNKKP
jgi:hypothetical protein